VQEAEGTQITSLVGIGVQYDTRNHPRTPNRGLFFKVGSDFAGVGGDTQYARFQAEARGYYPVFDKITLVGRVIGGHIVGLGGESVRLLDLFYKGGETIRGFDKAQARQCAIRSPRFRSGPMLSKKGLRVRWLPDSLR